MLIAMGATARAATPESEIKAVFIFHFTQFVEWPPAAFMAADSPFVIGIIGADPIGPALADVVRGETVGRHPLVVRQLGEGDAGSGCHILYVSAKADASLVLRRLQNAPVLTVGESDAFFRAGGIIQLYVDRRHVRLRVSLSEARSHSLVISAKLLRVADVTDGPTSDLKLPGGLAENGPLDLFAAWPRRAVFGAVGVKEVLADNR
jgi:hypothetical protein